MTVVEVLILLLIAAVIGALAQGIVGYSSGGLLVSIAVGFVGALLGMWIQRSAGAPELFAITVGGTTFPIVWSIIGAVIFVCLVALLSRPRRVVY
jgi:uncharacterized membrane protein YeaQ/YmgE (transglycosylase-associated protein family)